jgi:hypothetical protein
MDKRYFVNIRSCFSLGVNFTKEGKQAKITLHPIPLNSADNSKELSSETMVSLKDPSLKLLSMLINLVYFIVFIGGYC